jgi:hypothetical protein
MEQRPVFWDTIRSLPSIVALTDGQKELGDTVENEGYISIWRVFRALGMLPHEQKISVEIQNKFHMKESTVEICYNIMVEKIVCL